MSDFAPVFSVDAQCRDCYKCVRRCPVKAIRVVNDHAEVSKDECVFCGTCVAVCKHRAKVVRDDLPMVRRWAEAGVKMVASLAPSFASEFPGLGASQVFTLIKKLGFSQVYETAQGANIVSRRVAELMAASTKPELMISSACPVVVTLIQKHFPLFASYLSPVDSPLIAHCKWIHEREPGVSIVFIGPCIGKKHESDELPNELKAALTFEDLRRWLTMKGLDDWVNVPPDPSYHLPGDGAYYPIEGGMLRSVERNVNALAPKHAWSTMTISGLPAIKAMLESLDPEHLRQSLFVEALACPGGCICGPKTSAKCPATGRLDLLAHAEYTKPDDPEQKPDITHEYAPDPLKTSVFTEEQIEETLRALGKFQPEDELDCSGCGYESCRDLARAILEGKAELQMCVSHMRQLAQKKSNAIDRAIPYGLVVADAKLKIIECNERFAELLGETMHLAYEARPGLRDADLERILPYPKLFQHVLETGNDVLRKTVEVDGKLFSLTVFNVEAHTSVGALILDVTETEQRRKQLIDTARTVIQNTSKTVQEIAFMLGRNAAQSEVILNSAVEMFAPLDRQEDEFNE